MDALAITAVTNFLLACELYLLGGMLLKHPKARGSAAWFWTGALLLLATSALLGGIDHGFVEPLGHTPQRTLLERGNWLVLGVMTGFVVMTIARQFLPVSWQRPALIFAALQFILFALLVIFVGRFIVVIVNYAPAILALLIFSAIGLRNGTGSPALVTGLVIMVIASLVQVLRVAVFYPLDHNGLYHLLAMFGAIFLYRGGLRLKTAV